MASNLTVKLPEMLCGDKIPASDADMRAFYEQHKDERYRYNARQALQLLEIDLSQKDSAQTLKAIERAIQGGADFADIMAAHDKQRGRFEMTIAENSKAHAAYKDIYDLAAESEIGAISGPHLADGKLVFFRVTGREPGGIVPYEDALAFVRRDFCAQTFERYLQQQTERIQNPENPERREPK
jgi:hypothetical protein